MNDAVLGQLRHIVATYGPEICADPRRVEGLLRDLSGEHRREIAVLVGAVREGVPAELLAGRNSALPAVTRERLVRMLRDNLGLAADAAQWAVRTWALALDVTGLEPSVPVSGNRQTARSVSQPGPADAGQQIERLVNAALDVATSIPEKDVQACALGSVATALVQSDPARAEELLSEAEQLVQAITSENVKTRALHDLSVTLAVTDPDRAERLAQSMTHASLLKDDALGYLARALVDADPDRALRVAWSINHEGLKGYELAGLATALAATDPDRAERLAVSLTGDYWKAAALSSLATGLAALDAGRAAHLLGEAERLALSLTDEAAKASALGNVAQALAPADPGRAAQLLDEAERLALSLTYEPGCRCWVT